MSNPATLDDLRAFVVAGARKVGRGFRAPDDDWRQVFFVQTPSGVTIMPMPEERMRYGADKDLLAAVMREAVVRLGAYRYAFLGNMHYKPVAFDTPEHKDEALDVINAVRADEVRVQEMPDAVEALILVIGDAESEQLWSCEIRRDERRPPTLGPWERWDDRPGAGFDGRFSRINRYMQAGAAMRYEVAPFYNTRPMAMLDGYREGDTLTRGVLTLDVEASNATHAADKAWYELNKDDRENGQEERSLSVGDVVMVSGNDGDTYLAAVTVGWRQVQLW